MPAFIDLKDSVIGNLTVMQCIGKLKGRYYMWKCRCNCEAKTIVIVNGHYLLEARRESPNGTRSCGCLRRVPKPRPVAIDRQWNLMQVDETRIVTGIRTKVFHTQIAQLKGKRPECAQWQWRARKINELEIEVRRIQ